MKAKIPQKSQIYFLFATVALIFNLSTPVRSQTVFETITETGLLKVAIREDAAPFSYLNDNDELQGYCVDFIAVLEQKLKQELSRQAIAIRPIKSTVNNRFQLVERGLVYLECGANTIQDLSSTKVTFSRPFFRTGTQFLINTKQKFAIDSDLAGVTIGVVSNSTNEAFLKDQYPLANLISFYGTTARNRGLQALQQGKIVAMASDGVLLNTAAAQQKLSLENYILVPQVQ